MKYRYYHQSHAVASSPAGTLNAFDSKTKVGGTIFNGKKTELKVLVDAGFIVEEEVADDFDAPVVIAPTPEPEPVKVEGSVETDAPSTEGDLTVEEKAEEVEPVEESESPDKEEEEAADPTLVTMEELTRMSFAALRIYARQFGIKGTSYKELLREVTEADKVAE